MTEATARPQGNSASPLQAAGERARSWNDEAMLTAPMFLGSDLPDAAAADAGPLFGSTFVVKDNFDIAGSSTTAGCPSFGVVADRTAPTIRQLLAAGAQLLGRANMDQFATGLNGTRSPYGTPRNPLDERIIPGGSSSGTATAVAARIVDFGLGTDTAGSGRVPAAMTQTVGLKPTRGLVTTAGILPACASLDCVSIHTRDVDTAWDVFENLRSSAPDESCRDDRAIVPGAGPGDLTVGVPASLEGVDRRIVESFRRMLGRMKDLGVKFVEMDFALLYEAGELLYGGPFVAERTAAVGAFISAHADEVHPVTREIIEGGRAWTAAELHRAQMRVRSLRAQVRSWWAPIDLIAVPSVPTAPTLEAMAAAPVELNSALGRFTSFTNLLDLCAITVPDPEEPRPGAGCTLQAQAHGDRLIAGLASHVLGGRDLRAPVAGDGVDVVVAGAHLRGEPLNHEITGLGGRFVARTTTAPTYRLWVLADGKRPALVRSGSGGRSIEVEIWSLPAAAIAHFLRRIEAPLGLGTVTLADGTARPGFICEPDAVPTATEITQYGSWRAWLAAAGHVGLTTAQPTEGNRTNGT